MFKFSKQNQFIKIYEHSKEFNWKSSQNQLHFVHCRDSQKANPISPTVSMCHQQHFDNIHWTPLTVISPLTQNGRQRNINRTSYEENSLPSNAWPSPKLKTDRVWHFWDENCEYFRRVLLLLPLLVLNFPFIPEKRSGLDLLLKLFKMFVLVFFPAGGTGLKHCAFIFIIRSQLSCQIVL